MFNTRKNSAAVAQADNLPDLISGIEDEYDEDDESFLFDNPNCVPLLVPLKYITLLDGTPIQSAESVAEDSFSGNYAFTPKKPEILLLYTSPKSYAIIRGREQIRYYLNYDVVSAIVYKAPENNINKLVKNLILLQDLENLHFLDQGDAMKNVIKLAQIRQKDLSYWLSVSQPCIGNKLRITKLDKNVKNLCKSLNLTERHCRALLYVNRVTLQLHIARQAAYYDVSSNKLESYMKTLDMRFANTVPTDAEYISEFDMLVDTAIFDANIVIESFHKNMCGEVKRLRSFGIPIVYDRSDNSESTKFYIKVPKSL